MKTSDQLDDPAVLTPHLADGWVCLDAVAKVRMFIADTKCTAHARFYGSSLGDGLNFVIACVQINFYRNVV